MAGHTPAGRGVPRRGNVEGAGVLEAHTGRQRRDEGEGNVERTGMPGAHTWYQTSEEKGKVERDWRA